MKIIYLTIESYIGISFGAIHFYGELSEDFPKDGRKRKKVELSRVLTADDVIKLNKQSREHPGVYKYRVGMEFPGFPGKQEIIDLALNTWKDHFPDGDILVLGRVESASPQKILEGPPEIKHKVNSWYEQYEFLQKQDKKNEKLIDRISNEFWEFWKGIAR